jgi:hypothetical protein
MVSVGCANASEEQRRNDDRVSHDPADLLE